MARDLILPSAARAAGAGVRTTMVVPADRPFRVDLNLTASTAPTTLDVKVEHSEDGGTTWNTLATFTQLGAVATGSQSVHVPAPHSELIAVTYTLVGTSYTFQVSVRS
jgi:hypothetical protein